MTTEDLATGNELKATIDAITAMQAKIATTDVTPFIYFVLGTEQYISGGDLKEMLGDSPYNTICNTAKTSISTALTTAKATAQTAFDALLD